MVVFTPSNLFSGIACPHKDQCNLTNCIFNHDLSLQSEGQRDLRTETTAPLPTGAPQAHALEPPTKRRKLTQDNASRSKADEIRSQLAAARNKAPAHADSETQAAETSSSGQLKSLKRPVSPPLSSKPLNPASTRSDVAADNSKHSHQNSVTSRHVTASSGLLKSNNTSTTAPKHEARPSEGLNPRLIPNDPAGHSKRSLLLKYLHGEMVRLNRVVQESDTLQHKDLLTLTESELVTMALDEEEALARSQPQLYSNVMKTRIGGYRKMTVAGWTEQLQLGFKKSTLSTTSTKNGKSIQTNLKPDEEIAILSHLTVPDQSKLEPYGYIPTPPTEAEAAQAAEAVEVSRNYEECERCAARFQVYPDRNESGLLASNGTCKHHPNRKRFPPRTRGETAQGAIKDAYYPCCDGKVGSPGCTESEYHVFKASTSGRLAAVMPFITTPENQNVGKDKHGKDVKAVSFDCEMAYTVKGMELIRLTAITWPAGEELLDILVRPLGTIIDLNSRFSGVWPEHFANAIPYEQWLRSQSQSNFSAVTPHDSLSRALPVVSSPQEARALLCSYLTPDTPLIGHAIENDLNAVRLCHPTIIDTVLLFPHPKNLPIRYGLKMLAERRLNRVIQNGGDRGHDSLEDAVATGDLVRVKVGEKWKTMWALGWRFVEGGALVDMREKSAKVKALALADTLAGEKKDGRHAAQL